MKAYRQLMIAMVMGIALIAVTTDDTLAVETYTVDGVHSFAVFRINHLGIADVYGRFNSPAGKVVYDPSSGALTAIAVSVKVSDIDTGNAKRDEHLTSADFFDAAKYAEIQFNGDTFKKMADHTFEVTGQLNLHGVTRPLTVTIHATGSGQDPWGGFRRGFKTEFKIKRSDFGITFMLENNLIGDEVTLWVSLEGIKQ